MYIFWLEARAFGQRGDIQKSVDMGSMRSGSLISLYRDQFTSL